MNPSNENISALPQNFSPIDWETNPEGIVKNPEEQKVLEQFLQFAKGPAFGDWVKKNPYLSDKLITHLKSTKLNSTELKNVQLFIIPKVRHSFPTKTLKVGELEVEIPVILIQGKSKIIDEMIKDTQSGESKKTEEEEDIIKLSVNKDSMIDERTLSDVIKYLFDSDESVINEKNVMGLLMLSHQYEMAELKVETLKFLQSMVSDKGKPRKNFNMILNLINFSKDNQIPELKHICIAKCISILDELSEKTTGRKFLLDYLNKNDEFIRDTKPLLLKFFIENEFKFSLEIENLVSPSQSFKSLIEEAKELKENGLELGYKNERFFVWISEKTNLDFLRKLNTKTDLKIEGLSFVYDRNGSMNDLMEQVKDIGTISTIFPSIKSLDLTCQMIQKLPKVWEDNLIELVLYCPNLLKLNLPKASFVKCDSCVSLTDLEAPVAKKVIGEDLRELVNVKIPSEAELKFINCPLLPKNMISKSFNTPKPKQKIKKINRQLENFDIDL